jgi:hypothetical protein
MLDEDFVPITPVNFFQVQADCLYVSKSFPFLTGQNFAKYLLPDLSAMCSEGSFAQMAMRWSEEGLEFFRSTSLFTRSFIRKLNAEIVSS